MAVRGSVGKARVTAASKLQAALPPAVFIASWILIVHVAGIALFTTGFLLTRPVFPDVAAHPVPALTADSGFDRLVVLVVDALRYDFALPTSPEEAMHAPYYRNHLPFQAISQDPSQSFLLKFLADPPTTTLQRLKGLTTGSLPTFIDAGSNFAGTNIDEDNWLAQVARVGRVTFAGDDTWQALFGHVFHEAYPYDSLNVRDFDTVDNGVKEHLPRLIADANNKVVIGHMLGIDHVGHRFGPNHTAMRTKMLETGSFIRELAGQIDESTLLLVFGDHGMDQTGNHGGDSADELQAALWAYTRKPGAFSSEGESTVRQIDLVPTLASLLRVPVPFNNLGFPIRQAFASYEDYQMAALSTANQISIYAEKFGKASFNGHDLAAAMNYQRRLLRSFSATWVNFNLYRMVFGASLIGFSVICMIFLYNSLHSLSIAILARNMTLGGFLGAMIAGVSLLFVYSQTSLRDSAIFVSSGMSAGALLGSLTSLAFRPVTSLSLHTFFSFLLLALQCAVVFSNSFIILEPQVLNFLALTAVGGLFLSIMRSKTQDRLRGGTLTIILAFIIRLQSLVGICREENGEDCVSTFYERGSSVTPLWALLGFSVLSFVLPQLLQLQFSYSGNSHGAAKLAQQGTYPAMLLANFYWALDAAEVRGLMTAGSFETLKIALARFILAVAFAGGIYIWARSNLAIQVSFLNDRPRIEGIGNIYGSYAMVPPILFFWGLFVVSKPPGSVALAGLLVSIFVIFDVLDLATAKYSLLAQVVLNLTAQIAFYATGHQATLVSIQWDSAFIAAYKLSYPISAITVFLNTMGPQLIVGVVSVLIAGWRRPPFKDPRLLLAYSLRALLGASIVASINALGTIISVTLLRRHLMTWKIFAPRFMFGSITLLVIDLGAIIGLLIASQSVRKVTDIFS